MLTLKTVMCGSIIHKHEDSGKCVSKRDDSYVTLTDECAGDKNIFCYDSVSRFIKLQDEEDDCVTIVSNNLVLRDCNEVNDNMKWVYTEDSLIRKTSSTICWDFSIESNIMKVAGGGDQEFFFQLMKSGGKKSKVQIVLRKLNSVTLE